MADETSLTENKSMGDYGTTGGSIKSNGYYDYIKDGYGTKLTENMDKYRSPLLSKSLLSSYDAQEVENTDLYPYDNFDKSDIKDPRNGYQASKMLGAGLSMTEDNAYRSVFSNMGIDY